MPITNLSHADGDVLLQLINQYDQYIQNASQNKCFQHPDWVPLTIEEYYDTEFKLVTEKLTEQQVAATVEEKSNTGWSTFSKNELLAPKQKPWWRRLLPW